MSRRVWAGLAALVVGGIVTYGARGSFGLFIKPWEEAFGADRATVSLVSAVGFVALGLAQPFAGRLLDRVGGKAVLLVGLATCAIGLAVAALASELWQAIVGAGVIASAGAGFASLSTMSFIAAGLVERRSGIAFGVLTAAAAGGQVIVLPIATVVLNVSLQASMALLALLVAMAFLIAAIVVPATPPTGAGDRGSVMGDLASIAKTRGFWFLLVPFFICGYTSTGLTDTHLIPYATDHHLSEATASAALATLAAFNVAGVLLSLLTDRLDRGKSSRSPTRLAPASCSCSPRSHRRPPVRVRSFLRPRRLRHGAADDLAHPVGLCRRRLGVRTQSDLGRTPGGLGSRGVGRGLVLHADRQLRPLVLDRGGCAAGGRRSQLARPFGASIGAAFRASGRARLSRGTHTSR